VIRLIGIVVDRELPPAAQKHRGNLVPSGQGELEAAVTSPEQRVCSPVVVESVPRIGTRKKRKIPIKKSNKTAQKPETGRNKLPKKGERGEVLKF